MIISLYNRYHIPVDQSVTSLEKSETLKFKMGVSIGKTNVSFFLQIYLALPILFTPGGT